MVRADRDAEPASDARRSRVAARAWQASARQSFRTCRAGRLAAEVMVEGDDAMHLGARQVERLGDHRHGRAVDIAERRLERVQDRQQGALGALTRTQ